MTDLRDSWQPRLRVTEVAKRAGVHPVYLARCVRRWYGFGLADELRRLRLCSATSDLSETRDTVSHIAHRNGFSDEPHLCRDVHRSLGVTPKVFRDMVRNLS